MARKRLLHLTFDMRIGGAEQVIKTLVENTDQSDYEVSILCLETSIGPFGKLLLKAGHRIETLSKNPGFDISLIFKLRRYLIDHQINILHCHQYTPWAYGALASTCTKTRVIFTEHGRFYPDRTSWKRRIINPILLLLTDRVTAISEATRRALDQYEFVPSSTIHVIYNGIEPLSAKNCNFVKTRTELGIPDHTRVIGTIARLDPVKNQLMMLRAFKQVTELNDDIRLLIVGDGQEMQNLTQLTHNLELDEKVIFTGFIDQPENHLFIMDIFLLSSLSEGAAMTLLEAMSLSKPCVVTDAGGNAELILNQYNGLVVENDNANEFASAISIILSDDTLFKSMGKNARKRFDEMFSATKMCERYRSLYQ